MNWIEAIGFQKEALHVGVLRHLLGLLAGVELARVLTDDESISAIDGVTTEARLNGAKRPIDLAVYVTAGARTGWLGVEVKTDSVWSERQLRETLPEGVAGVLLAVGRTAFAVEEDDMKEISKRTSIPWRCVRPAEFARMVRDHAEGDRELFKYADRLEQEAHEHETARAAVHDCRRVVSERDAQALEHWAYFSEVLRARRDAPEWERKSLISGPLMTLWVKPGEVEADYLEFMGERNRRSLCVKTYAPTPLALRNRRARLIAQLDGMSYLHDTPRLPAHTAKTCTAARFSLAERPPIDASRLVTDVATRLASTS